MRNWLAGAAAAGLLLLRLLWPGLPETVRGLLVGPEGEQAAREVFQAYSEGWYGRGGAVRVLGRLWDG